MQEEQANFFYKHYDGCKWLDHKGRPIKNWKTLACDRIWEFFLNERKNNQ